MYSLKKLPGKFSSILLAYFKIPPTILSRCQRFDFRRIATKEIFENLKLIVKAEGLNIDPDALGLIAKYSDGGMRDAQVMLDQITSFTKAKIGIKDITKLFGVVEDDALFELSDAIKKKGAVKALGVLDALINEGKDITQIALGLIEHFRNIVITKISSDIDNLIGAGPDKIKRYRDEASGFTIEEILYIIYTFSNAIDFIKKSSLSRVPVEAALVKLTLNHPIVPLSDVIKRVETLEKSRGVQALQADSANRSKVADTKPLAPDSMVKSADLEEILSSWSAVINHITPHKISVASYLQEGYPVSLEGKTLSIGLAKDLQFHKEVLESQENKSLIEKAIKTVLGKELKIVFILTEPVDSPRKYPGSSEEASPDGFNEAGMPVKKEMDPIIKTALEMFGGDITDSGQNRKIAK